MTVVIILLILIIGVIGVLIFGGTKQRKREREARKQERYNQKQAKEQLKNKKKKAKKDEFVDIFKEEKNDNIKKGKTANAKEYSKDIEELQPKTEIDTNVGLEELNQPELDEIIASDDIFENNKETQKQDDFEQFKEPAREEDNFGQFETLEKEENRTKQFEEPKKENNELNFESLMENEEIVDEVEFNEALFGDVEEFDPEKAMNEKLDEKAKTEPSVKEDSNGMNDDIFSGIEEFDPEKAMKEQAEKEEKQRLEEQAEIMNYKSEKQEDDNLLEFFNGEDLNNEENK